MTTASTSAIIIQTSTANFDLWVNEVYNNIVTNCGLGAMSLSMDTAQMAVPSVTAVPGSANQSAGYYMFFFNDTLSLGPLVTGTALVALTAGTGYNGGTAHTFTGVALSGGTGSGAIGTVVLGSSGVVSSITPTTAGTGYCIGDQLFVTSANIVAAGGSAGGGSSGFAFVGELASSAAPVVIKLEFGSGAAAADPQMYITVGTSWSSNGTIGAGTAGAVTTRVACLGGSAPASTSTAYTSRYCYNTTYGFMGIVFKIGGVTVAGTTTAMGSIILMRTSSNTGAANGNGVALITTSSSATGPGQAAANGYMQVISYTGNTVYPALSSNSSYWCPYPSAEPMFGLTSTAEAGTIFVFPVCTIDPVIRFSALLGLVQVSDFAIGATASVAIVGSTALTFICVGYPFADVGGFANMSANTVYLIMLWQ
jgi:hypothetical protein